MLDYGWIFGHFGLPALGIEGAAWATVVSLWCRVAVYAVLMMLPRYRRRYQTWSGRRFNASLFRRLLRYGGPSGLQLLVEIAGFTLFLLVVGTLGKDAMAATTLAFNVNCLAFVPMLGLGIALSTLVGQQLGRNNPKLAARATWTSLCDGHGLHGRDGPGVRAAARRAADGPRRGHSLRPSSRKLRDTTVILLRFVAAYCLFDAMNVVFAGALKGAGDTRFIMIVSLLLTPMPVVAAWAGIHFLDYGLLWCWIVITLWVCVLGVIYCARFLQGRWRTCA